MNLFRVFPYDSSAAEDQPGGALFRPIGGLGRIDNPALYRTLYVSDAEECAVAEQFGTIPVWHPEMLVHASGSRYALATLEAPDSLAIWDLNDTTNLRELDLTPRDVATRNRKKTQAWAARVFELHKYVGISWWSYYNPDWTAFGLWSSRRIKIVSVRSLELRDIAIIDASKAIVRSLSLK